ncbi:hypothetical protein EV359DRAFT_68809 [Lentinula novae-zelandiae]|nr:hypothetical protein EV359DRAFT_68809 [Lentinula novae-zelandiae]
MHQPRPHRIVDLDHISASAQLIPETQSAPAILSEFPRDHYHHLPESNHQWFPNPPRVQESHPYPTYYAPYPVYQTIQPPTEPPRSVTPKFKIEYSSIHATFLATIKDADSLKDRKSWIKWNEGVWQAVADGFVLGHICDEPLPGTPWTEWNTPLLRPTISPNPTRKELETRLKWDKNDGWTSSILTARLSDEARNHLPPMIDDRGERRTARQIYLRLKAAYQAAPDRKACLRIQDELLTSQIHGMDIEKFNLKWSSTLTTLRNYGYDIPWDTLISKYISKLPSGPRYVYLKQVLEEEFDQPGVIPNRELFDKFAIRLENTRNRELLDLADSGGGTYNRRFQRNGNGGTPDKPSELQKPKDPQNTPKPNNKPSAYVTTSSITNTSFER